MIRAEMEKVALRYLRRAWKKEGKFYVGDLYTKLCIAHLVGFGKCLLRKRQGSPRGVRR